MDTTVRHNLTIIGITGTLGAGKGTIVDYLVNEKAYLHFSVRSYLVDEIKRRGLPVNRDSMTSVANDLRSRHSPGFITDQLYEQAILAGKDCIIESIRTPGEISSLRQKGNFILLAVDAKAELRYQRIRQRKSETDAVDFETFMANEQREMHATDPNHQNLSACIRQADFVLYNDGSLENLHQQIDLILQTLN